jgi:hypothetical protein
MKVYVAYRYSCEGKVVPILNSIGRATQAGVELERKGIVAYVPHFDWLLAAVDGVDGKPSITLEQYYRHGIEWLKCCDALLLVDPEDYGPSKGVTAEVDYCLEHNIPVFTSIEDIPRKIPSCFGAAPCKSNCPTLKGCQEYRMLKYP